MPRAFGYHQISKHLCTKGNFELSPRIASGRFIAEEVTQTAAHPDKPHAGAGVLGAAMGWKARQAAWQPGPKSKLWIWVWLRKKALPYWVKAFTSNSTVPKSSHSAFPKSAGLDRGGYEACARKSTRTKKKNRTAVAEFGPWRSNPTWSLRCAKNWSLFRIRKSHGFFLRYHDIFFPSKFLQNKGSGKVILVAGLGNTLLGASSLGFPIVVAT